ncbi:MAG: rhodanese-like domain-containing protein, partial [Gemmatimonadales bacterium]
VPYDRELYLLAPDETKVREAEVALAAIGHDRVVGGFGLDAIAARQLAGNIRKTRRHPIADAPTLADEGRMILDVRDVEEWQGGHLPMAVLHPLSDLSSALEDLDRTTPIAVHCEAGTRSAIGASLLETLGFSDVVELTGGWAEWQGEK